MPSVTAARLCPSLIFVPPRFEIYRAVSHQIRQIFFRHTDLVEPLSLDEAYLDVTRDKQGIGSAIRIAELIRSAILEETGLTASAGVSYNKFLAKIASDQNKPDGLYVIRPGEGAGFVATLPVRRFYGVGPKTAARMGRLGIHSGADLRSRDMNFLAEQFGKSAEYLYHAARGIDSRPVRPDRIRKSVGRERTYGEDLTGEQAVREALDGIIDAVWQRMEGLGLVGRTVTLKLRYADFRQITRRRSCQYHLTARGQFADVARELLAQLIPLEDGVRLLGVSLSGLVVRDPPGTAHGGATVAEKQQAFDF
jgi:DNA polymerase-4